MQGLTRTIHSLSLLALFWWVSLVILIQPVMFIQTEREYLFSCDKKGGREVWGGTVHIHQTDIYFHNHCCLTDCHRLSQICLKIVGLPHSDLSQNWDFCWSRLELELSLLLVYMPLCINLQMYINSALSDCRYWTSDYRRMYANDYLGDIVDSPPVFSLCSLLLCFSLCDKHGSHSSGFMLWHSVWLKLHGWLIAKNPLLCHCCGILA